MNLGTASTNKIDRVGLIGVGNMGRPMLEHLQKAGLSVVAFDPFPSAQEFAKSKGALLAQSAEEVAEEAKLIIMSLPAPKQVFETLDAFISKLTAEHIIVDTSTVDPETSKEGARKVGTKGASYVDAPVLGRPSAAGNWLLPAGGSKEAVEIVKPVLRAFAREVVRVGDNGTGNAFKLLNQLMFSVINGISAEVMALTDVLGIDKNVFYEVISNSGAATVSGLFKETAGRIAQDRYDAPTFTMELLCKDARLGIQMAKDAGASPLIAGFVQSINENAKGKGLAKQDTSSLSKVFKEYFSKFE